MNTLTKVFVVLLVIFSIAFTMMSIQFSASVPDWRAQAETWKVKAQEVGSATVSGERLEDHVETMRFRAEAADGGGALLLLEWEHTRVVIPVTAVES